MIISVIIPAYNEEKVIARTLKSIPSNIETIVVCNGCTDNTAKIAKKFKAKVYEVSGPNVSHARNVGAKNASGTMLVFLDADISLESNTLKEISKSGYEIGTTYVKPNNDKFLAKLFLWIKSRIHKLGNSTGIVFCKDYVFKDVGGFNETVKWREDGIFLRKARKKFKFGVVKAYVINDMRRYEKEGYMKFLFFWLRNIIFPTKKPYPFVR